jgi:hypothetical protein
LKQEHSNAVLASALNLLHSAGGVGIMGLSETLENLKKPTN